MIRRITETVALAQLQRLKHAYQRLIMREYEHAAMSCKTCRNPGICCTDAHFVNVHITKLEALAIRKTLERTRRVSDEERRAVYKRARKTVETYGLRSSCPTFEQTYSCPLFDRACGCLVHQRAKPAPCIQHACYENWQNLPPDHLQTRTVYRVEQLNRSVYGDDWGWLPIPVWLSLVENTSESTSSE